MTWISPTWLLHFGSLLRMYSSSLQTEKTMPPCYSDKLRNLHGKFFNIRFLRLRCMTSRNRLESVAEEAFPFA